MIPATIGRIVWFFPPLDNGRHADGQPFSAMIAGVNDDGTINLMVAARDGSSYGAQKVPLLQDGDDIDQDKAHAVWMPYQKGQATKTEQTETGLLPRIEALEQLLTAGGTIHTLVDDLTKGIDGKFQALGDWLTPALDGLKNRLDALTQTPAAPPANPPQPQEAAAAGAGTDASGAGQQATT